MQALTLIAKIIYNLQYYVNIVNVMLIYNKKNILSMHILIFSKNEIPPKYRGKTGWKQSG